MLYVMLRKLGKNQDDLTKTDMMLKDFEGVVSPALGALCVDLTIGSKTLPTTFFVIVTPGFKDKTECITICMPGLSFIHIEII